MDATAEYRDPGLDQECPSWGGPETRAAPTVFDDLTAYVGTPLRVIGEEYWRYRKGDDVLAQRRVAEAAAAAPVLDYYAKTPHYLYELSYWEASVDKQAWFKVLYRACAKYRLKRTLDFGGGIGGLALFLNGGGIHCDYLDVRGKTFDYAAWRFARRNQNVVMFDASSPTWQAQDRYDAVFAWDVLEHLFDLEGAIRQVASLLRPGGWFLSKSTFAVAGGRHEAIHLAQHAGYTDVKKLNELLGRHGLRFVGQLKPNRPSRFMRAIGLRGAVAGIRVVPRPKHGGNFLVHEKVGR